MFNRWKTSKIIVFCGKPKVEALGNLKASFLVRLAKRGHPEADCLSRANLAVNKHGGLAYSLMSRSGGGGIRGGDGDTTSPPVTVW